MYRVHSRCQKAIYDFTDEIIKKKAIELNQNAHNEKRSEEEDDGIFQRPKTVIEILLGNQHKMSHEQIRDELVTIMIGKYEMTNK